MYQEEKQMTVKQYQGLYPEYGIRIRSVDFYILKVKYSFIFKRTR